MDDEMPGLNGVEATGKIRETLPAAKVIMFSANQTQEAIDCAFAAAAAAGRGGDGDEWPVGITLAHGLRSRSRRRWRTVRHKTPARRNCACAERYFFSLSPTQVSLLTINSESQFRHANS